MRAIKSRLSALATLFLLGGGLAHATSPMVESGGFNFFPAIRLTNQTSPQYVCASTTACGWQSNVVATGSIDRAFTFNILNSYSGNDRLLSLQQSSAEIFAFTKAGGIGFGTSLNMSLDFENGLGMAGMTLVDNTQPIGFYSSTTAANTPFILKAGADHTSGAHTRFTDAALSAEVDIAQVRFDGAYRFNGVATASLTTCGAGVKEIQYDTTTNTIKYCNQTAYQEVISKLTGSATLNFGSSAVTTCEDLTITVTGATTSDTVALGVPNGAMVTGSQFTAWISAADTVSVRHCCVGAATCDPASGTFVADVF